MALFRKNQTLAEKLEILKTKADAVSAKHDLAMQELENQFKEAENQIEATDRDTGKIFAAIGEAVAKKTLLDSLSKNIKKELGE